MTLICRLKKLSFSYHISDVILLYFFKKRFQFCSQIILTNDFRFSFKKNVHFSRYFSGEFHSISSKNVFNFVHSLAMQLRKHILRKLLCRFSSSLIIFATDSSLCVWTCQCEEPFKAENRKWKAFIKYCNTLQQLVSHFSINIFFGAIIKLSMNFVNFKR